MSWSRRKVFITWKTQAEETPDASTYFQMFQNKSRKMQQQVNKKYSLYHSFNFSVNSNIFKMKSEGETPKKAFFIFFKCHLV